MLKKKKLNLSENRITIFRHIVQIFSFLFINYIIIEFIFSINMFSFEGVIKFLPIQNTPRNPLSKGAGILEYIFFSIAEGEFPFLLLGILLLFLLLTNRFFCGWICPIGAIQDALCAIPTKDRKVKPDSHKFLLNIKFMIIIFLFIIVVPLGVTKTTDIVFYFQYKRNLGELSSKPLGYFSLSEYIFVFLPNLITKMWDRQGLEPLFKDYLTFGLFSFYLIILIVSIYYPRAYCRYFCPFGALASVVSDYSLLKLSRSPVRCVGRSECGICERVCPKQIKILDEPFQFFTGGGECNLCMKCKDKCPYYAIEIKFG